MFALKCGRNVRSSQQSWRVIVAVTYAVTNLLHMLCYKYFLYNSEAERSTYMSTFNYGQEGNLKDASWKTMNKLLK